jgi:hypothetical protein
MATLTKSPIKTKSKIKILYIADTAKEKPQHSPLNGLRELRCRTMATSTKSTIKI